MSTKDGAGFIFSVGVATVVGLLFGYFQWRTAVPPISSGIAVSIGMLMGTGVLMIVCPAVLGILNFNERHG